MGLHVLNCTEHENMSLSFPLASFCLCHCSPHLSLSPKKQWAPTYVFMLEGGFVSFWMACNTSWWSAVGSTSHRANRTGWMVNWSVFKPDSPQKEGRNHGAPTCNYHMEGNAAPSLHVLWSPLKIPLRELVIIRTHDSLITLLRSSRNTAQGVDTAGGVVVL